MLVLSGRAAEVDRLRAFERGADDFLAKPYSYPELRARIRSLLRRTAERPVADPVPGGAARARPGLA